MAKTFLQGSKGEISPKSDELTILPLSNIVWPMDYTVRAVSQLSDHLRSLRKARGLTQAELGRLLGVKQSRVADIERDPSVVSVDQLHTLLAALGIQLVLHDTGSAWSKPAAAKPPNKGSW